MADSNIADIKEDDVQLDQPAVTELIQSEIVKLDNARVEKTKNEEISIERNEETKADNPESKADVKGNKRPRHYDNGVLKTSAREDLDDVRKNRKYDPSLAPKPESKDDLPGVIRRQVDFYFSDSNLPGDAFLWNLTNGTANKPVPLEAIMKFGRMKIFNIDDVVSALQTSKFLNITGETGKEKIERKVAYDPTTDPKIVKKAQEDRSVYVKGFGDEVPTSQFDIEAFFAPFGPTNAVRLRRTSENLFKGSVFVEFESEELAKAFLNLDPKPLWKGEHIILVLSKTEYMTGKEQEIKDGKIIPSETWTRGRGGRGQSRGNRGSDRGRNSRGSRDRGDRGDRDPNNWKKRREADRANGFKEDRRAGGRGRGGRGRGGRDRDRKKSDGESRDIKESTSEDKPASAENTDVATAPVINEKKRDYEDGGNEDPAAKKVKVELEAIKSES